MESFLLIKKLFKISLLTIFIGMSFSMLAWASNHANQDQDKRKDAPFLWKVGFWPNVYVPAGRAPVSYMVADECPDGLNPSYNVALRQGFVMPTGSSGDYGIRGFHLKINKFGTDSVTKQIYINFSEAYLDTIGTEDKPIDVSYWIYCGP